MSEMKKREKVRKMFSSLKKEGSPGLPESKTPKNKEKLVDRGTHLEQNALENLFPGVDLSEILETEEDKKKKKLKLAQLMSDKLKHPKT